MRTQSHSVIVLLALSLATACAGPDGTQGDEQTPAPSEVDSGDWAGDDDDEDPVEDGDTDLAGDDDGGDDGDQDGEPEPSEPTPPTSAEFSSLGVAARDDLTQIYTIDPNDWSTIVGAQGTTVFIQAGSMVRSDGTPATGPVDLEMIEIFDKGSMLATNMPSIARNADGDVVQLISGGEHFIDASEDGEPLRLATGLQISVPTDLTGGPDDEMILFRADVQGEPDGESLSDFEAAGRDDEAVWVEDEDPRARVMIGEGGADGAATSYHTISGAFGWTNIDRWYSDPRPKTSIHVSVPEGWDDSNCEVYLSYDGEPTALARMDVFNSATGLFTEHYGQIPVGLDVHVIFVTEENGEWSYAIQGTTIEEDHVTDFDSAAALIQADTDALIAAINQLP